MSPALVQTPICARASKFSELRFGIVRGVSNSLLTKRLEFAHMPTTIQRELELMPSTDMVSLWLSLAPAGAEQEPLSPGWMSPRPAISFKTCASGQRVWNDPGLRQ